jgi:hypothetical protein
MSCNCTLNSPKSFPSKYGRVDFEERIKKHLGEWRVN